MSFRDNNPYLSEYPDYLVNRPKKTDDTNPKKLFTRLDEIREQQDIIDMKLKKQEIADLKKDILYLANQIQYTANETSKELDTQGKTILKIDPKLDQISENLDRSDNIVGIIKNKLNKFAFWKTNRHSRRPATTKITLNDDKKDKKLGEIIQEKQSDTSDDEFCDALITQLNQIKNTNLHIGEELDAHNDALRHMSDKVDNNNKHIEDLNRDIFRLLR